MVDAGGGHGGGHLGEVVDQEPQVRLVETLQLRPHCCHLVLRGQRRINPSGSVDPAYANKTRPEFGKLVIKSRRYS